MDADAAFKEIRNDIAQGRTAQVGDKVIALAEADRDPFTLIKCLSLLKVVGDDAASKKIIRMLEDSLPETIDGKVEVAGALRGLDYPASAYSILRTLEPDDAVRRMSAMCQMDLDEYETALDIILSVQDPTSRDRIMLTETYSALGEHKMAVATAEELLSKLPDDYEVQRCYASALVLAGMDKEAVKYVRARLKDKDADANALAAFVMRVTGNIKAAAGYATRALKIDPKHISAMETLGICLAQKGEIDKARIVAGAINEASPGNRAALNVLAYCE